ncbi:hypothetical protein [Streptomyces sp. ODS05-4]|uniref:hypothetical protein n=1 Tax=Streptomyces sp. ODS05-4 TaxID=2944939 RepID=UPI00210B15E3|nr:hypothetical protein [Streptomyces sp. ODS05-4]
MSSTAPVLEIVEFTTSEGVGAPDLRQALGLLEADLRAAGGFLAQTLYASADRPSGWIIGYHWATLEDARQSMRRVADTDSFAALMKLVDDPGAIRMSYGVPAGDA